MRGREGWKGRGGEGRGGGKGTLLKLEASDFSHTQCIPTPCMQLNIARSSKETSTNKKIHGFKNTWLVASQCLASRFSN